MSGITPVPRTAIVVVAAGSGTRLGHAMPKAFVAIDGRSILEHCLDRVFAAPPAQIVVVVPAGFEGDALTRAQTCADAADARHPLPSGARRELVSVVVGGAERGDSVAAGLRALWGEIELVLVHDAARALTPADVFERVEAAVGASGAATVPVVPVIDSLKSVERAPDDTIRIVGSVDRAALAGAQTPQGFRRDVLEAAARRAVAAGESYTDEAGLVAAAGHSVDAVQGDELSFKITTAADLARARALLDGGGDADGAANAPVPASVPFRVGVGTDVHAFGEGGVLWLAGLEWPGQPPLSGHSDGDAVAHAIVDALLAAAGLGDIGTHFGVDRPEFAGAHAEAFLRRTRSLLAEAGWRIGNVSVQVQAARPRFSPRRAEAEQVLSAALGAPVSVSATTTDGLGFVGTREGVQAVAVALVVR